MGDTWLDYPHSESSLENLIMIIVLGVFVLSELYNYSPRAFIGGSLGGIQNLLMNIFVSFPLSAASAFGAAGSVGSIFGLIAAYAFVLFAFSSIMGALISKLNIKATLWVIVALLLIVLI